MYSYRAHLIRSEEKIRVKMTEGFNVNTLNKRKMLKKLIHKNVEVF